MDLRVGALVSRIDRREDECLEIGDSLSLLPFKLLDDGASPIHLGRDLVDPRAAVDVNDGHVRPPVHGSGEPPGLPLQTSL